jgi:hypothetical protein
MFTQKQIDEFTNINKKTEALKYGQEIILEDNEFSIIYHIFPKLLNDNQFFKFKIHKEIFNYTLPVKYNDEIDKINNDMLIDGDNFKIYTGYNYSNSK